MRTRDLAIIAAIGLAFPACKKDAQAPPAPGGDGGSQGTVRLAVSFTNAGQPFGIGSTYVDPDGHNIRFTNLKFFLSKFHLSDDGGDVVGDFPDKIVLVDLAASQNLFTIGSLAPAHVHEVGFLAGLDSATRHMETILATPPLDDQDMWWNWDAGAGAFPIKVEGYVDANGDQAHNDGEQVFEYHVFGPTLQPALTHLHLHANVAAGSTHTLHATVDIPTLLDGIAIGSEHGAGPVNVQLLQNLASAIEGVE